MSSEMGTGVREDTVHLCYLCGKSLNAAEAKDMKEEEKRRCDGCVLAEMNDPVEDDDDSLDNPDDIAIISSVVLSGPLNPLDGTKCSTCGSTSVKWVYANGNAYCEKCEEFKNDYEEYLDSAE